MRAESRPVRNEQILEEASSWFVEFRVGDIDPVSRERFDHWLRTSPEHIRAYMEIAKTYVELHALKSARSIDIDALVARSDANVLRLREAAPPAVASPHRQPMVRKWALAASLALVSLAGALSISFWQHRYPTYTTEIGENRSITLADGSTVDLNARSKVRIEFSKGERHVKLLEGQALFEVTKDAARPFIVRSGAAVVRAIGTQFDVNRGQSRTTVTVVEGRVAVLNESAATPASPRLGGSLETTASSTERQPGGATYVSAGEQVTVTPAQITPPQRADVAAVTAWTQHHMIFDGTPLNEVVETFNRYNTRPLVIEDPTLKDFRVSGVYASTDPASLIRFLEEQPGITVAESTDAIRITRP
jgi:transmembrane sensor